MWSYTGTVPPGTAGDCGGSGCSYLVCCWLYHHGHSCHLSLMIEEVHAQSTLHLWFIKKWQLFSAQRILPLLLLSSSSHCLSWNFFLSSSLYSSTRPCCFLVLTSTLPVALLLLLAVLHIWHLTPSIFTLWEPADLGQPNKRLAGKVDERGLVLGED